ncbi:hypothetical protein FB45DRAFT_912182 [Roridomyces roridus]|uniref:Uncharacterized protein n=1 Tax=Roridomyces roridus TaxID=1738132 RepID=A0AAD7BWC2_9AGAR|nr:hypothetical protein FB45DRAFT_912182 [Roridomyces roridus]
MPAISTILIVPRDSTSESKIPVAAMVGGLVGGVVLGLLFTAGWLLWARTVRLSKERDQQEQAARNKTRSNTHLNASAGLWTGGYRPMLLRPATARVRFMEKSAFSAPKPLRSAKGNVERRQMQARAPRMPSTVSSASLYSADSAEEHQIQAPSSIILAALGSMEAVLTRGSLGDRRPVPQQRGSQATASTHSRENVGVAY